LANPIPLNLADSIDLPTGVCPFQLNQVLGNHSQRHANKGDNEQVKNHASHATALSAHILWLAADESLIHLDRGPRCPHHHWLDFLRVFDDPSLWSQVNCSHASAERISKHKSQPCRCSWQRGNNQSKYRFLFNRPV
jgi:hypothetical protein